jgi:hypothetical protein
MIKVSYIYLINLIMADIEMTAIKSIQDTNTLESPTALARSRTRTEVRGGDKHAP